MTQESQRPRANALIVMDRGHMEAAIPYPFLQVIFKSVAASVTPK